ncbi:hypothetical protein CDEST_02363 [Colletotrichum destructivum]|uniref:Uncharacterized protein n=1 Tax=Colletotrichum destructivum TaxID=34406 RepID=A0AAX4I2R6_9PEZI|nr:hypothetical protein CDEST_02363 [Colletotrichum destructivum]
MEFRLHTAQQSTWLDVEVVHAADLTPDDLVAETRQRRVTAVQALFGLDAAGPQPHWTLASLPSPSRESCAQPRLRTRGDGTFRTVQGTDTHVVTGKGVCNDALNARGGGIYL